MFLLDQANINVLELKARLKHLEAYVARLEKEKQALLEEREKLLERIEKLELENQALKQGRSVRSYQDAKMLKALAEKAREGVSWKALCAEVLGLRDENKIKRLLKLVFVVRKDQHNKFPEEFYPKDIAEEFRGWVLKRPGGVADIIDYILYKEDTLKAAQSLVIETPKPAAEGQPAVEVARVKVEEVLRKWVRDYEKYSLNRHSKTSPEEFIQSIARNGLRRLVREYGFDVVAEVVGSDPDFRVLFGPFLLKLSEKRLEVEADV